MANYQAIMRLRPEVRDFVRNRKWVHRGDVVTYGPNIACDSFSTDAAGFRHSVHGGRTMSVNDCLQSDRYGLVLGPSSVYGFGLAGNENSMPSQLAERFGFPFANVGLPEGNSRNLFSLLTAFIARAPHVPAVVLHISGGDFTSFCYSSIADPVFGPPNILQVKQVVKERGGKVPVQPQIKPLLAFTALWIRAIGQLCRLHKIPLVLANDTTFFEKSDPSATDRECELGKPINPAQGRQFAVHNKYVDEYGARRSAVAEALGVPLAGPGRPNALGYVDEFHYDREGTRALCDDFAGAIQTLL